MKVVILAGGYGSRISEESHLKPKPMVEIGEKPMLWHIMKIYSHFGFNDFIICLGYKGHCIKEYFAHYFLYGSDVTYDFTSSNREIIHDHVVEPWKVTLVNTGVQSMTGGRIKRIKKYVGDSAFLMTYGDGVSNVNVHELVKFHKSKGKIATLTSVQPSGRYGALEIGENDVVTGFYEKPKGDNAWVNAGFFVLEPQIFDYIEGDRTIFEREPLETMAQMNELVTYKHYGFWHAMDTMRDKALLESHWSSGNAPWKLWKETQANSLITV